MECPYCDVELEYHDYFGRIAQHQDGHVAGDIYVCENEACDAFQQHFYTYRDKPDELIEGYPC
jgi:hypothetical protein